MRKILFFLSSKFWYYRPRFIFLCIIFYGFNFGRERKYDIGVENLEGKYKDWQKKLHPDLVHSKSEVSLSSSSFLLLEIQNFDSLLFWLENLVLC